MTRLRWSAALTRPGYVNLHLCDMKSVHRHIYVQFYLLVQKKRSSTEQIGSWGTLGESLAVKSPPRSSWGVTRPDELYTLIFRLGRGSSRGELVIGILSETS